MAIFKPVLAPRHLDTADHLVLTLTTKVQNVDALRDVDNEVLRIFGEAGVVDDLSLPHGEALKEGRLDIGGRGLQCAPTDALRPQEPLVEVRPIVMARMGQGIISFFGLLEYLLDFGAIVFQKSVSNVWRSTEAELSDEVCQA